MNFRLVEMKDYPFLVECYADWPLTNLGPITVDKVAGWIRYWLARDGEDCVIGEVDGAPVGLMIYRRNWFVLYLKNIVVHPVHRKQGHANAMVRALRDKMLADGVVVAEFDAMAGPIAEQVEKGKFNKVGESQGETGKLIRGQLTQDMDV